MKLADQLFKMANDMNRIKSGQIRHHTCQHCKLTPELNKRFCTFHLEEHRTNKGKEWAEILKLNQDEEGKYITEWGSKSARDIFSVIITLSGTKGEY